MIFEKINISAIVRDHLKTIVNHNTQKPSCDDIMIFLLLPIIFSIIMIYYKLYLGINAITIVITALSIFIGLLFNVIILIFDLLNKPNGNQYKYPLLQELISNISFTIFISIIIISLCLLHLLPIKVIKPIADSGIYFLLAIFFLTILMILKRTYSLFKGELKETNKNQNNTNA